MKKMTRNEFLKMAGTSAALVVINTALVPTAIAAEPIGTVLSAKKSVNTGTIYPMDDYHPRHSNHFL